MCVSVCLSVFVVRVSGSDVLLYVAWLFFPFFLFLSSFVTSFAVMLFPYFSTAVFFFVYKKGVPGICPCEPAFFVSAFHILFLRSWFLTSFVFALRAFLISPVSCPPPLFFAKKKCRCVFPCICIIMFHYLGLACVTAAGAHSHRDPGPPPPGPPSPRARTHKHGRRGTTEN